MHQYNRRKARLLQALGRKGLVACFIACFCGTAYAQLQPPAQDYCLRFYIETWWGGQYAKTDDDTAINLGSAFTLELWVYLEQATQGANLLGKPMEGEPPTGLANVRYALSLDYDTGLRPEFVQAADTASTRTSVLADNPLPLNAWTHVAGVLNNGVMTLYVNGMEAASGPSPGPPTPGMEPFYVGGYPSSFEPARGVPGCLKQVRVWNRALSPAEIAQFAAQPLTGTEPGLLACWPLDERAGSSARDTSGSGFDLILGASGWLTLPPMRMPEHVLIDGPYFIAHPYQAVPLPPEGGSDVIVAVDFDHDGDSDFVRHAFNNQFSPPITGPFTALRNVSGVLTDVSGEVLVGSPAELGAATQGATPVADFTGDGIDDVFLGMYGLHTDHPEGEQDRLLVGTSDGRLIDETDSRIPQGTDSTHAVTFGDIDGDSDLDIFVANAGCSDHVSRFYINDGTGHFTADETRFPWFSLEQAIYPNNACLVDVDNDGDLDMVYGVETNTSDSDVLALNDGAGFFSLSPVPLPPRLMAHPYSGSEGATSADFNNDGYQDLVMQVWFSIEGMPLSTPQLLMNNGNGTFRDAMDRLPLNWQDLEHPDIFTYYSRSVDFNGDGWVDMVLDGELAMTERLLLNQGNGHFCDATFLISFPNRQIGAMPLLVQMDNDSDPDLLINAGYTSYSFVEQVKTYDILGTDTDGDGLINEQETLDLDPVTAGVQNPFDPNVADSTGDNGSTDPDGIPDGQNDWDGDGVSNADEFTWGSNPIDPDSTPSLPLAPWASGALGGLLAACFTFCLHRLRLRMLLHWTGTGTAGGATAGD